MLVLDLCVCELWFVVVAVWPFVGLLLIVLLVSGVRFTFAYCLFIVIDLCIVVVCCVVIMLVLNLFRFACSLCCVVCWVVLLWYGTVCFVALCSLCFEFCWGNC